MLKSRADEKNSSEQYILTAVYVLRRGDHVVLCHDYANQFSNASGFKLKTQAAKRFLMDNVKIVGLKLDMIIRG